MTAALRWLKASWRWIALAVAVLWALLWTLLRRPRVDEALTRHRRDELDDVGAELRRVEAEAREAAEALPAESEARADLRDLAAREAAADTAEREAARPPVSHDWPLPTAPERFPRRRG